MYEFRIDPARISADVPGMAEHIREVHRRDRLRRRVARLMAVPPPARQPIPEDYPEPPEGRDHD